MSAPYRKQALALLNSNTPLSRKAGSFCGQVAVDATPLTPRQIEWLEALLLRAGLPGISGGEAHE